jgi:2-iminobutanoate/2-iminopropanoate deaminase
MDQLEKIQTAQAPAALGPYSQGVIVPAHAQLIFVSGQVPIDLATGKLIQGDIGEMTALVISHIQHILQAAHSDLQFVVRTDVFLKDLNDFGRFNEIYQKYFVSSPLPARQTIQAAKLPLDAPIEISCIAIIPHK